MKKLLAVAVVVLLTVACAFAQGTGQVPSGLPGSNTVQGQVDPNAVVMDPAPPQAVAPSVRVAQGQPAEAPDVQPPTAPTPPATAPAPKTPAVDTRAFLVDVASRDGHEVVKSDSKPDLLVPTWDQDSPNPSTKSRCSSVWNCLHDFKIWVSKRFERSDARTQALETKHNGFVSWTTGMWSWAAGILSRHNDRLNDHDARLRALETVAAPPATTPAQPPAAAPPVAAPPPTTPPA